MIGIYSVHDRESETFIKPFGMETDRDAKEGFKVVVNDEKTNYHKYPDDFSLVKLGSFDQRTGQLLILEDRQTICWAKDLVILDNKEKGQ